MLSLVGLFSGKFPRRVASLILQGSSRCVACGDWSLACWLLATWTIVKDDSKDDSIVVNHRLITDLISLSTKFGIYNLYHDMVDGCEILHHLVWLKPYEKNVTKPPINFCRNSSIHCIALSLIKIGSMSQKCDGLPGRLRNYISWSIGKTKHGNVRMFVLR